MTEITVKIGAFERTYILVETDAPQRYDGFGTLELYSSRAASPHNISAHLPCTRMILVDVEHKEWQEGRNRSGLHSFDVVEDDLSQWAQDKLYKRLTRPVEEVTNG